MLQGLCSLWFCRSLILTKGQHGGCYYTVSITKRLCFEWYALHDACWQSCALDIESGHIHCFSNNLFLSMVQVSLKQAILSGSFSFYFSYSFCDGAQDGQKWKKTVQIPSSLALFQALSFRTPESIGLRCGCLWVNKWTQAWWINFCQPDECDWYSSPNKELQEFCSLCYINMEGILSGKYVWNIFKVEFKD